MGHGSRKLAAKVFDLNPEEMENRHNEAFGTYELGKLTIEEYFSRVVFYEKRPFTPEQFRRSMFAQSKPFPQTIELLFGLRDMQMGKESTSQCPMMKGMNGMKGMDEKSGDDSRRTEMTSERHNAPRHNLHANQAGNAGDCTSSAHSSLPWRRLRRFFATTTLASFVLNEIWEMAQMSAYVDTTGHSWTSTLGLCTRAAVGDVGIVLGIYASGALAAGDLGWGLRSRWNIYATAAVLGLAYAALVEHAALAAGRWSYTERMPVVSVLGAGLWPLLQMTLLPPLTFLFARWWAGRSATKGSL